MDKYSYTDCLDRSRRVNWRIDEVLDGSTFDTSRPWLPASLSAVDHVTCLSDDERRKLTQVEMGAYAHIFRYVEEFIAPQVSALAQDFSSQGDRAQFEALCSFAAEEIKHMELFRRVRSMVDEAVGFELALIGEERATAEWVNGHTRGSVLLLTACIEWFVQLHYVDAFKDDRNLDPLTKQIFRAHWLEESQHAQLDHLETLRAFDGLTDAERDRAIDDLIELVTGVDGLLQKQSAFDVDNLERYIARELSPTDRRTVQDAVLAAKRHTFIMSGVTHPRFQELFNLVTNRSQRERVARALDAIAPAVAA